jgi:ribosomal protein L22
LKLQTIKYMNIRSIHTVLSRVEKNKDKHLWLKNILVVKVFVNTSPVLLQFKYKARTEL